MKRWQIIIICWFTFTLTAHALAAEKMLTIIHTNDMHSHVLGAPPNIEYTPSMTGDDDTIGGWARIATVINDVKSKYGPGAGRRRFFNGIPFSHAQSGAGLRTEADENNGL
jgi:2',3'-cyclic-nucleotide 2'-phosphodiesterase (5'-nucleotidase family)